MGNALWLLLALPKWYFACFADPFEAGPLTLVPFLGILCLAGGVIEGIRRRDKRLLLFIVPFVASQIFVSIAGAARGQIDGSPAMLVTMSFLIGQLLLAAWMIFWLRGARLPALALAGFSLSYAGFAAFVATMSFADSWL